LPGIPHPSSLKIYDLKSFPREGPDRIVSIDVLRGISVLGILIMNIQSFSMPAAAYMNPTAYGDVTGINKWIWILSHILASEKFISLFSLLFGAGVLIFSEKAVANGQNDASLHYRRMGWLLLFGLAHGYLLWYGDILVTYSLCGMLLFMFRRMPPEKLVKAALGFFMVPVALDLIFSLSMPLWPDGAVHNLIQGWKPDESVLQHDLEGYRAGWPGQMKVRVPETIFMQTGWFMAHTFWRVMAMMLLGMALYKWKVLGAERTGGFYARMSFIGLVTGCGLSILGVVLNFKNQWSAEFSMYIGSQFNYIGSAGVALGYTGIVMLICRSAEAARFRALFSSVGRMAFTSYFIQTVICTLIFYGHGLGLYGRVERNIQLIMVAGIWIVVLIISPLWLKIFRFGPLEWLWRSLTYRERQPFLNTRSFQQEHA
jgi:uncharacterized protein